MSKELTCVRKGENLVVTMPISTLKYACEHHPETPYIVFDKDAFAEFIAKRLLTHDEDEAGNSAFHRLLDEIFAEAFVEGVVDEGDDESDGDA